MYKFHIKVFLSLLLLVFLSLHSIFAQNECAEKVWEWGPSLKIIDYHISDIDNDGVNEILASNSQLFGPFRTMNYWQVFDFDTINKRYDPRFIQIEYDGQINTILTHDFNKDGTLDIFLFILVSAGGSMIKVVDGSTFEELTQTRFALKFRNPFIADINGDNSSEVLVSTINSDHYVFEMNDSLEQVYFGPGAYDDIGDIDGDSTLEAISFSHTGFGVAIHQFVHYDSYIDTFVSISRDNGGIQNAYLAHLDQDGMEELVVEQRVNAFLQIYDLDSMKLKWEWEDTLATGRMFPSTSADTDKDGFNELLYIYLGNHLSNAFSFGCLDLQSRQVKWRIDTLFSSYFASTIEAEISVANLDDDDDLEILFFGDGQLTILALDSTGIVYDFPREGSGDAYFATLANDLDKDGQLDYVIAGNFFHDVEYGIPDFPRKGWLRVYDAQSHELGFSSSLRRTKYALTSTLDIASGNINSDPSKELVLVGKFGRYPGLTILDADSFEPDTSMELGRDFTITNVEIADLENDGQNEIFISFRADTNTPDYFLYCLNGNDLSIKFKAVADRWVRNTGVYSMRSGDIDGDGADEVIAQMIQSITDNNNTLIIDLDDNGNPIVDTAFHNFSGLGLDLEDMNGDGTKDIVASNGLGIVKSFDYKNDSLIWEKQVSDYSINCLRIYNVDPDSTKELVVIDDGALSIYDLDEDSLKCTDIYGYTLGFINNMYVGDKDNDGTIEVFTSGIISVLEFELNPFAAVGVEDYGFESKEILIYPNPNSGNFQLALPTRVDEISSVKIYSLLGELIWEQEIRNRNLSEMNIQLPGISNGIYLVQIWNEKELLWTTKMSVQD